jgi:hypothetical protein
MGRAAAAVCVALVPAVVPPKKDEKAEGHAEQETYPTLCIDTVPRPNVTASVVATTYLTHKE